jgi:hypothetical protein
VGIIRGNHLKMRFQSQSTNFFSEVIRVLITETRQDNTLLASVARLILGGRALREAEQIILAFRYTHMDIYLQESQGCQCRLCPEYVLSQR